MTETIVLSDAAAASAVVAISFALAAAYSFGVAKGKLAKIEEVDEKRDSRITWIEQRLENAEANLDDVEAAIRGGDGS